MAYINGSPSYKSVQEWILQYCREALIYKVIQGLWFCLSCGLDISHDIICSGLPAQYLQEGR
jgi:hypothetical protein